VIASRTLARPIALAAMVLLVVNDHVLKAVYPGFVTGKLSDFAGLMFFPLLLAAACEQIGIRRGMTTVIAASVATGVVFASIKLSPAAGELYRIVLAGMQWPFRAGFALIIGNPMPAMGHALLVADPTDLIALVALAVPVVLSRGRSVPATDTTDDARPALAHGRDARCGKSLDNPRTQLPLRAWMRGLKEKWRQRGRSGPYRGWLRSHPPSDHRSIRTPTG
jgi:hypothetical protein